MTSKRQCFDIWPLLPCVQLKLLWFIFSILINWNYNHKKLKKWRGGSSAGCLSVNVSFILSGYTCQYVNRVHSATCKWTMSPLLCLSFTAYCHWKDSILLIISAVVNSGGRIWSIQLTAWQLFLLSRVVLAKTYSCQLTKKIWLGEGIHMVPFSSWVLKNVPMICGKMPVFKDRTEDLYRK